MPLTENVSARVAFPEGGGWRSKAHAAPRAPAPLPASPLTGPLCKDALGARARPHEGQNRGSLFGLGLPSCVKREKENEKASRTEADENRQMGRKGKGATTGEVSGVPGPSAPSRC